MTEATSRQRVRAVRWSLAFLIFFSAIGALAWGMWVSSRASIEEAIAFADADRLDRAESVVRAVLAHETDNDAARLFLAQLVLKQADPPSNPAIPGTVPDRGQDAFDQLSPIRPRSLRMAVAFHLCRGDAYDRLHRFDSAEADWLEALRISPSATDAGLKLLNMYYLLGRRDDSRGLVHRLLQNCGADLGLRVRWLLELIKQDVRPPAPESLVPLLEPVVAKYPGDFQAAMAFGAALTRGGRVEDGINQLRRTIHDHPDRIEPWDKLLTALDDSGQIEAMQGELKRMPLALSTSPPLLKHRARVAQGQNWPEAAALYRKARAAEPGNRVLEYRLGRALRVLGENAEAEQIEARSRTRDRAIKSLRPLYKQAAETQGLGSASQAGLYQQIADAREQMELAEEAIEWHRIVLETNPENQVSLSALSRLEAEGQAR